MSIDVLPKTLIAGANDPAYEVSKDAWNAGGLLSGGGAAAGAVAVIGADGNPAWGGGLYCSVNRDAPMSVPNNADTAIVWDAETSDAAAMHDPSTNPSRITIPGPGIWLVSAVVRFATNATGYRRIRLATDGAASSYLIDNNVGSAATDIWLNFAWPVYASAAHYYEVLAFQNSGGALNVTNALFAMMRLRSVP